MPTAAPVSKNWPPAMSWMLRLPPWSSFQWPSANTAGSAHAATTSESCALLTITVGPWLSRR
jgi:hypothetical protein